jgi:Uma2 family endonuclease
MATVEQTQREPRFILRGIAWPVYQSLREAPGNYHVRMTYDRGDLEIMSPSGLHERYSYILGRLIDVWTEELSIDVGSCRTMTFKREDLDRGLEPDNCYYVEHEAQMRQKTELDLTIDPPPDLAVEVEVSTPAIRKMPLYAAFGVPEVWRFDGQTLQVFRLGPAGQYEPRAGSGCLPQFPIAEAAEVLGQVNTASETALVRSFRDRVRASAARPTG